MKKFAMFLMVALYSTSITVAQDVKQEVNKDSYELVGDMIEAVLYHDNGKVAQKGTYNKKGVLHGDWISYDRQGNLQSVAHYDNGNKVGTWRFYTDETMKEVTYVDSRISEVTTYEMTDTRVVSNNK